jgi:hypothetical protein
MSKSKLIEKLEKYDVKTTGLRVDQLKTLLKDLKEKEDLTYEDPEDLKFTPITLEASTNVKKDLEENGYCVVNVPGWTGNEENELKAIVESFTPFRFEDKSTWKAKNLPTTLHGILKHDLGHTKLQWDLRLKMQSIFADIYEDENLLCSFDSINISYPRRINTPFYHVDQNRDNRDLKCYQSIVNLRDNGDKDGGLLVVHGSHKIFDTYLNTHPKFGYRWDLVQMGDPLIKDLPIYKINLKSGQACIWSSKVIHCNCGPTRDNLRLAVYVSMMPRNDCPQKDIEKRIRYFETGRITSHWCYGKQFKANGKSDMRGSQVHRAPKNLDFKDLNEEQRQLVGYDE